MGKSLLLVVLAMGCTHVMNQDARTGPDGKIRGAREVAIVEGTAKTRGIVTYPGGDRVDWRKIVLPEKERGTLDIQLSYKTPRPGLRLSFDVFDGTQRKVKLAVKGAKTATQSISIPDAAGTYFVRVYAKRRGDAGAYKLDAQFVPAAAPAVAGGFDPTAVPVADPPRLPDVPEPPVAPKPCPTWDPGNPECMKSCVVGAPANHPVCEKEAKDRAEAERIANLPPPPKPLTGRVVKSDLAPDGGMLVFVGVGSDHGIGKDWKTGTLLRGNSTNKLPGAVVTVVRVDKRTTLVKITGVTSDVINQNKNVEIGP